MIAEFITFPSQLLKVRRLEEAVGDKKKELKQTMKEGLNGKKISLITFKQASDASWLSTNEMKVAR